MRTEDIIKDIADMQDMKPSEADISQVRIQLENDHISDLLNQSVREDKSNEAKS